MAGCVQPVLAPAINDATIRLLNRLGTEVVVPRQAGCCGALVHHLGKTGPAHKQAAANIAAWTEELAWAGLDAIVINASGCGTTVKDYGHMFCTDAARADAAARVSELARDITEFVTELGLPAPTTDTSLKVTYHSACSMQHGQRLEKQPVALLRQAGFETVEPREAHLCCGSAGTYNLLQPVLANQLRDRKVINIEAQSPDVIATGNIGCMVQIAGSTKVPVTHTVELLDWATGGPRPAALSERAA